MLLQLKCILKNADFICSNSHSYMINNCQMNIYQFPHVRHPCCLLTEGMGSIVHFMSLLALLTRGTPLTTRSKFIKVRYSDAFGGGKRGSNPNCSQLMLIKCSKHNGTIKVHQHVQNESNYIRPVKMCFSSEKSQKGGGGEEGGGFFFKDRENDTWSCIQWTDWNCIRIQQVYLNCHEIVCVWKLVKI